STNDLSLRRFIRARLHFETVSLAWNGFDVARRAPIIVELHAKLPDVTIDDIALDLEVAAPDARQQALACEHLTGVRGQDVQEGLLDRRELEAAAAAQLHGLLDTVDLELAAEADLRLQRAAEAARPPHAGARAG